MDALVLYGNDFVIWPFHDLCPRTEKFINDDADKYPTHHYREPFSLPETVQVIFGVFFRILPVAFSG